MPFNMKASLYILFSCFIFTVNAQINSKIIHSHNDYNQKVPFWNAYANGANSIEVDIILKDNNLYVAHDSHKIDLKKTIESLYLIPLESALDMNFKSSETILYLLIDIKSEAIITLNKLIEVLKKYPKIINSKSIKLVISGNRPEIKNYSNYPNYIYFDYQEIQDSISKSSLKKVAMISTGFKQFSNWNGKGRLTHIDKQKVEKIIKKAKKLKKPFRFWATPDSKTAWKAFSELGVDIINTDKPAKCFNYLNELPQKIAEIKSFSKVYTPTFKINSSKKTVKNIILLIGDGNGLSQISSTALVNNGELTLTQLKEIGLIKTQSADDFTTDSAAAGTALATGKKTNNRAIGVNPKGKPIKNIIEIVSEQGFNTGIITTDEITGATPAAFYAHQKDRSQKNEIATDLINSNLNLFIGGGGATFENLAIENKFQLIKSTNDLKKANNKVGFFISKKKPTPIQNGRDNILAEVTKESIAFFKQKQKPFFLLVEAAQIDSFGHYNDTNGIITESIDFDKAITEAIKFADKDGETLVIITADHETGGFSIPQGNIKNHLIEGSFTTNDHTATMVPIFAYGPQSHLFTGVYENTEVFFKILKSISK